MRRDLTPCLQEILTRLNNQEICATIKKAAYLLGVSCSKVGERDVAERREFPARAH